MTQMIQWACERLRGRVGIHHTARGAHRPNRCTGGGKHHERYICLSLRANLGDIFFSFRGNKASQSLPLEHGLDRLRGDCIAYERCMLELPCRFDLFSPYPRTPLSAASLSTGIESLQ